MLQPDKRKQLDGIVKEMAKNKESDKDIQFVVDDFKKKYEKKKSITFGQQFKKGLGELVQPAIGAAKGVASLPVRGARLIETTGQALGSKLGEAVGGKKIESQPSALKRTISAMQPTNLGQEIGFGAEQVGEFLSPTTAILKGRQAIQGAKAISKLPKALRGTAKLAGVAGLEGAGFGAVTALQEGEINKEVGTSAAIGAALPVVGAGYQKFIKPVLKQKLPAKLINSLIKPPAKEFSFGRNPGLAVAKEGIKANSIDGLKKGIVSKKKLIGQKIGSAVKKAKGYSDITEDIGNVVNKHIKNQTDDLVVTRFNNVLDQLLNIKQPIMKSGKIALETVGQRNISKMNPKELFRLLKKTGKLTQWTGAPADKPVNKMLSELYGVLGKKLDKVAKVKPLQTRYANLMGAEKSIEKRINTLSRSDVLGLKNILGGGVVGGLTGETPGDRAVNALIGGVLGKAAGSTLVKSRLASGLAKESTGALAQRFMGATAKDVSKRGANVTNDMVRLSSPRLRR